MHRERVTDDVLLIALSAGDRARFERMATAELVAAYDGAFRRVEAESERLAQDRARCRAIGAILRRRMAADGVGQVVADGPRGVRVRLVVQADGRGFRRERVDVAAGPVACGIIKPDAGSG